MKMIMRRVLSVILVFLTCINAVNISVFAQDNALGIESEYIEPTVFEDVYEGDDFKVTFILN